MTRTWTEPGIRPVHPINRTPGQEPKLMVYTAGISDRGMARKSNQDNFLIAELTKAMQIRKSSLPQPHTQFGAERGYLFLVADGIGGHQGGGQASALVVGSIENFVLNTLRWFFGLHGPDESNVLTEFQAALRQADARIFEVASGHPELVGMGTTLTMAYSIGLQLFVVHVGDSRCYLHRNGELHQLTHDHTLVEELVHGGHIDAQEAARHRLRHVITNAIGGAEKGLRVEAHKVELEIGDTMLLCTDGLTEMLDRDRVLDILNAEQDPERACERLVGEANEAGGRDNITVVMARFEAQAGPVN